MHGGTGKGDAMKTLLALIGTMLVYGRQFGALCIRHRLLRSLGHAGHGVSLGENVRLYGARHIQIGADAVIGHHVTLRALTDYPWTDPPQTFTPVLRLGRGCFVSSFTHVSCARRVEIGEEVMIADRCFLSDNQHRYQDPGLSVKRQPLEPPGEIHIGDGAWLGAGVCIVGNIRIGCNSVVGANAVVTHDLPDRCVAVGAPARIIRRYDSQIRAWRQTRPDGAFIE